MLGDLVRKLFHTAFVAFGVATLVFAALRLSGDPASTMLPGDSSVEELAALRRALGLDQPLLEAMADMWSKAGIRARVEMMEMAARQKMNNERSTPPHGLLLIDPQSTLLDADGSFWRLFHPNGFGGRFRTGSQPGQRSAT